MPYKNPEVRKQKNLEYKQARRAILSQKERERRARKLVEDREGLLAKERAQSRATHARRKSDPDYRKKLCEYAKKRYYEKLRDCPNYKAKARAKTRTWAAANKERSRRSIAEWRRKQMLKDSNYRLGMLLRKRLNIALRKHLQRNGGRAIRYLGCTLSELRDWLEAQFLPGMTWDTYGIDGWHIDHIKPLASFDLTNLDDLKRACHYTNLRPLWALENSRRYYLEAA